MPECDELPNALQDCLDNTHAVGAHRQAASTLTKGCWQREITEVVAWYSFKPIASAAGMMSSPSSPSWWNHHISLL